jgi:SAM-dependent methyltransferase
MVSAGTKRRRSLTNVGGTVDVAGDREVASHLAQALDVSPAPAPGGSSETDDADRAHVHGFHTYPARMHPVTARRLVRALAREGAMVFDPFCGSGTVLVEAMLAGRRAIGTDLNPLAVRLARLKTSGLDEAACAALIVGAREVATFADERRRRRAGSTRRYPRADVEVFEPHVLLELDSIRAGIKQRVEDVTMRGALELVLSAILVKLSRRTSDTSGALLRRRLAAGFPARLFARKAEELARRLGEMRALLPPGSAPARVEIDDATRLQTIKASTVDAVVASPPYVATYDYLAQHELRMRWLDLDARGLLAGEMGARRRYAELDARGAGEAWRRELVAALRAIARVCRKGAKVALLVGDSAVQGEALRADAIVASVAGESGLTWVARASQPRPHFHGPGAPAFRGAPRAEHAIVLEKR